MITSASKLLVRKFGTAPDEIVNNMGTLDLEGMQRVIEELFVLESLDEVKKFVEELK